MKLYGSYTSPYVRHCRIALMQEGFDFELIETDYAASAEQSPCGKVPFFRDGDLFLTDSSSILKYIREKTGKVFIPNVRDFDLYALVNTLMDSAINIFLLEKDGITPENSNYVKRQKTRVIEGIQDLDKLLLNDFDLSNDLYIRAACFIAWGAYRNRFSIDGLGNLNALLTKANLSDEFQRTAPSA